MCPHYVEGFTKYHCEKCCARFRAVYVQMKENGIALMDQEIQNIKNKYGSKINMMDKLLEELSKESVDRNSDFLDYAQHCDKTYTHIDSDC